MAIPPVPKKPGTFMERISAAEKASAIVPPAPPRTEIISFKRNKTLEPWMIATAAEGFRNAGTVKMVANLLNVTEARLSGWLAESENEDCQDELLLSFGHACRLSRETVNTEVMKWWKAHAVGDVKACIELARSMNPELNPTKKVDVSAKVVAAPKRNYDKLSEEETERLIELEMKLLED